jgi:hypothetical protein
MFDSLIIALDVAKSFSILYLHFFIIRLCGPEKVSNLSKRIQAHASWNLVKRCNIFDVSDVEALESIRMEILAHEIGEVI